MGFIFEMKVCCNIYNLIHKIHYISRIKDNSCMIISVDAETVFNKIKHLFIIKIPQQMRYRSDISQHNKGYIQ